MQNFDFRLVLKERETQYINGYLCNFAGNRDSRAFLNHAYHCGALDSN